MEGLKPITDTSLAICRRTKRAITGYPLTSSLALPRNSLEKLVIEFSKYHPLVIAHLPFKNSVLACPKAGSTETEKKRKKD